MPLPKTYGTNSTAGAGTTASVGSGGTIVTGGNGTAWAGIVEADDYFRAQGLSVRIASVGGNGTLTLVEGWPGAALPAGSSYEISITGDGPERQLKMREIAEQLSAIEANSRGLFYLFDTATADADPGDGELRFNHATISSATACYIDNLDANDAAVSGEIDTWDDDGASTDRGKLWVRSVEQPEIFYSFRVTGSAVDGSGYRKLTLQNVSGSGTLNAGDEIMVYFVPKGPKGIDGGGMPGSRVRVVATSNVAIATGLENGDTIDGVTLVTGDLVLLTGQTAAAENGVYAAAASGAAARDTSFDTYDEHPGAFFSVMEGTTYADTLWRCTSNKGGTLGTTALAFSRPNVASVLSDGGILSGFRNKLINGDFDHWQRGTSQTSSDYGSDDRWKNVHSGSTKTHSQQSFTLGQTDVPGNPRYYSRTVVSSVAGASNYVIKQQLVEGVRTLAGRQVTLTFWAKADANKNIALEVLQDFGSGGSPSAAVLTPLGLAALTTAWQEFQFTVTLPSISGKTLGTDGKDHLQINFWLDAGSDFNSRASNLGQQSGTFDIAHVSLVEGDATTETDPFSPRHIQQELALCQRYYEKGIVRMRAGLISGSIEQTLMFHNTKRASPTMTEDGGTTTIAISDTEMFVISDTNGSTGNVNWTADAEL